MISIFVVSFVFFFSSLIEGLNVNVSDGVFQQTMKLNINSTQEQFLVFSNGSSTNPYRIYTWISYTAPTKPVLVTVQQENASTSWSIPSKESRSLVASRTLCYNTQQRYPDQNFVVLLSTSSKKNVTVYLLVAPVIDFFLQNERSYAVYLSVSEPSYYLYNFHKNTSDLATITVWPGKSCLTLSIQKNNCPVWDSIEDVTHDGQYESLSESGAITIQASDYRNGFFLVLVSKTDCHLDIYSQRTLINFTVTETSSNYTTGVLVILEIYLNFCIIAIALVCIFAYFQTEAEEYVLITSEQTDSEMTVDKLVSSDTHTSKSKEYAINILNAAIFYGIPVVQVMLTYAKLVNQTGDEDLCYYNFQCASPAFGLNNFNHVFSNIGYILLGILFLGVVKYRSFKARNSEQENGIPTFYGLFYAMGIALINVGVLSACYHVCPNQSSYQYDTSFMYLIAILCMVKLYENRHSNVTARAYTILSILGIFIFISVAGMIVDGGHTWFTITIQIIAAVIYVILCGYVSLKIYFFTLDFDDIRRLLKEMHETGVSYLVPKRKGRFWVLAVVNLINYVLFGVGLYLNYKYQLLDLSYFLLLALLNNTILYAVIYTSMKIVYQEEVGLQAIFYGILASLGWCSCFYFFYKSFDQWTISPADSLGHKCIFLNFYDNHDIWHFLSSSALYFTFMYLLYLDDNVSHKPRRHLKIF